MKQHTDKRRMLAVVTVMRGSDSRYEVYVSSDIGMNCDVTNTLSQALARVCEMVTAHASEGNQP